jgi:sialic acid synthase SpsE/radical SAM superfamily enzyme YgiQ (UPF0313 family)
MTYKNALLIVHDVYQDFNHFPLGPAYLAAMLEKAGYSVEIYSMDVFHYTNDELKTHLKNNSYNLIGLGFLAARFEETIADLARIIDENKKNAWFCLGGPGPSPIPEYMIERTNADIIMIGEAEETIVELMNAKTKNYSLENIKGIAFKKENKIIINERRKPIQNLDSIPFPAWHLFPMEKYITNFKAPGMEDNDRMLSIVTSRGCVNRCSFCYRMEKGIRIRSLQNIIDEMKFIKEKYNINYFFILDELFVLNEKRTLDFEKLLLENKLTNIKYTVEARVDMFNKTIAESLKRTGCTYVNIGFESGTQKILDQIGKNVTVEQNINVLKICEEVGLPAGLNFIWGFPDDDYETLRKNVELIKKYNQYSQLRTIRPVTAYPGTDLYYYAIDKKLLDGPADFFEKFKNSDLITTNFTKFDNQTCYKWLLEANTELILDHYNHTNKSIDEAHNLIQQFKDLYDGKITKFRGARTYDKKKVEKMAEIKLGNKIVNKESPIYFIGEIGINHNGDLKIAKQLIDMAAMLGIDCVKFQKRTPELCVPKEVRNQIRETPWGEMTYFDYKKKIEFEKEEYDEIDKYCKEKGIAWTASAWDISSLDFLEQYDIPFHKIASAKLTDKELLLKIKKSGKPVVLSVGMSTEDEITKALELFGNDYPVSILHCNSGYPAKEDELNLKYIIKLRKKYPNFVIGYSGHEVGLSPTLVAGVLGAKIIERHITLDRSMWGTDQSASVEYQGLRTLLRDLNKIHTWVGSGDKIVTETEQKVKSKLRDKNTL